MPMPAPEQKARAAVAEKPAVPIGTSFSTQKYLFAFATQPEVRRHLRTQLLPHEAARIDEILEAWVKVQPRVEALVVAEAGLAETVSEVELPADLSPKVEAMLDNDLFRKSFDLPLSVAMVEIDKLVAAQRMVN